jgi:rhodanese-related sulfurtransferase
MSAIARIHPLEVQRKLKAGEKIQFLDVRQPEEYEAARIGDIQLIPLGELSARVGEVVTSDETLLVVYCHHGIRSLTGVAILHQAGIENAASLSGGIDLWSQLIDPNVPRY